MWVDQEDDNQFSRSLDYEFEIHSDRNSMIFTRDFNVKIRELS